MDRSSNLEQEALTTPRPIKLRGRTFSYFLLPTLLFFIADATMSYFFPVFVGTALDSNLAVGAVMALSSFTGIIFDAVAPRLLRGRSWLWMLSFVGILSPLFIWLTFSGEQMRELLPFLGAAIVWGIYFELLTFAQQAYVLTRKRQSFSRVWSVIYVIVQFCGMLGPLLGSYLLFANRGSVLVGLSLLPLTALLFLLAGRQTGLINVRKRHHEHPTTSDVHFSALGEARAYLLLLRAIYPAVIVNTSLEFIDASFWTLGGLFALQLGGGDYGWLIIVVYQLPLLLGSMLLANIQISTGKKRLSQLALLIGSTGLILLGVVPPTLLVVGLIVLLSSLAFAVAVPLSLSVYSDLAQRGGIASPYIQSALQATSSIGYLSAPLIVGFAADRFGYGPAFAFVGAVIAIIALILLFTTQRKLHVPHTGLQALTEPS